MEKLLEFVQMFDIDFTTIILAKIAAVIGSFRMVMKPVTSFWINKIAPYIDIRPKEKLLKHPLYKSITFFIDWSISVKLPQEKKDD